MQHRFEAAFIFPYASYPWKSKRGRECWLDVEWWQDCLAGPVSTIVEHAGCAYVYARNDEFFTDVTEPAALLARLRHWHEKLVAGVDGFAPTSPDEAADLASMRQFALAIWAVSEEAWEIERDRWEAADVQT